MGNIFSRKEAGEKEKKQDEAEEEESASSSSISPEPKSPEIKEVPLAPPPLLSSQPESKPPEPSISTAPREPETKEALPVLLRGENIQLSTDPERYVDRERLLASDGSVLLDTTYFQTSKTMTSSTGAEITNLASGQVVDLLLSPSPEHAEDHRMKTIVLIGLEGVEGKPDLVKIRMELKSQFMSIFSNNPPYWFLAWRIQSLSNTISELHNFLINQARAVGPSQVGSTLFGGAKNIHIALLHDQKPLLVSKDQQGRVEAFYHEGDEVDEGDEGEVTLAFRVGFR